jgi:glycosyltransferase involved in cell wall biosynthesis
MSPDGAVFAMPRSSKEWLGAPAMWVTAAGWASAAQRRFGSAWVTTPDAIAGPADVLGYTEPRPATVSNAQRLRLPVALGVALKDARQASRAWQFRDAGEPAEWRRGNLAFVWQHHDLFARAGFPVARRHGCPLVSYVHAPQVWEARRWGVRRPGWGALLERFGEQPQLRESDVVACVSEEVATELARFDVPRERILVSPMAVDVEQFNPEVSGAGVRRRLGLTDAFVVGWAGTFRSFHAVDDIVVAFAGLHRGSPSARLLLVGTGAEEEHIRGLANRLGIAGAVVFTGPVPNLAMPEYLAAMDVTVVSAPAGAEFHYSPQKLREYLGLGRAAIAPRLGEIPTAFEEGTHLLLYEAGNVDDLSDAMCRLRDDAELRRRVGSAGWERVLATATWDVRLEELMDFDGFAAAARRV